MPLQFPLSPASKTFSQERNKREQLASKLHAAFSSLGSETIGVEQLTAVLQILDADAWSEEKVLDLSHSLSRDGDDRIYVSDFIQFITGCTVESGVEEDDFVMGFTPERKNNLLTDPRAVSTRSAEDHKHMQTSSDESASSSNVVLKIPDPVASIDTRDDLGSEFRQFGLEKVPNLRDIAGFESPWKCELGKIKQNVLFRTGQWVAATPADLNVIRNVLGVKTYVDLRNPAKTHEGLAAPAFAEDFYPPAPGGPEKQQPGMRRRVACNLEGPLKGLLSKLHAADPKDWTQEHLGFGTQKQLTRKREIIEGAVKDLEALEGRGLRGNVLSKCKGMWTILLLNQKGVKKTMDMLADPRNYPLAFGCSEGKDRTGLIAMLCLGALGVNEEDIETDYMLTNRSTLHINECILHNYLEVLKVMREEDPDSFVETVSNAKTNIPELYNAAVESGLVLGLPVDSPASRRSNVAEAASEQSGNGIADEQILRFLLRQLNTHFGGIKGYLDWSGFCNYDGLRRALVDEHSTS